MFITKAVAEDNSIFLSHPGDQKLKERLLSLAKIVPFSPNDIRLGSVHSYWVGKQIRSPVTENPAKIKARIFHSVTIEGQQFNGKVLDDGNVYIESANPHLHFDVWSARLGKSSIRQFPNSEINHFAAMFLDVPSTPKANWWVCEYSNWILEKIPLITLSSEGLFALAHEFGLPIVPLTPRTIPSFLGWKLDFEPPVPDKTTDLIPSDVVNVFDMGSSDEGAFYASPAFDKLCEWVKRNPKRISSTKAGKSRLGNWVKAAQFVNENSI